MNKIEIENRLKYLDTQILNKRQSIENSLNELQKLCLEFKALSEQLEKIEEKNEI